MASIDIKTLNKEAENDPRAMIMRAESSYHAKISELANRVVAANDLRAILLAGPSGSGKTTTANLLADKIRALGEEATVLSLDDFYLDAKDDSYPKDKNGERDFECPEALNLADLENTLASITAGKPFLAPKYDFKVAARVEEAIHPAMPDGCVIIEGLHALNPKISENLPKDRILKLFVSVSTNIYDGDARIISGRKLRFVRRLVRDSIYRAADAARTLCMWRGVLEGEDAYLYPYKSTADVAFDTFHSFELGVMKAEATRLLNVGDVEKDPYAAVVLEALLKVKDIDTALVPADSLLREFISGGIYDSVYR